MKASPAQRSIAKECRRKSPAATGFRRRSRRCGCWVYSDSVESARASKLMHRRRIELALDALEMIDPLDRAVEFRAFLLGKLGFHVGNRVGEPGPIEVLHRGRNIGEHGEALVGNFRQAAE